MLKFHSLVLLFVFSSCTLAPPVKKTELVADNLHITYRFTHSWIEKVLGSGELVMGIVDVKKNPAINLPAHLKNELKVYFPNATLNRVKIPQKKVILAKKELYKTLNQNMIDNGSDFYVDFFLENGTYLIDESKTSIPHFLWILTSVLTLTLIPSPEYTKASLTAIVYDSKMRPVKLYQSEQTDTLWVWLPFIFHPDSKLIGTQARKPTFDKALNAIMEQIKEDKVLNLSASMIKI